MKTEYFRKLFVLEFAENEKQTFSTLPCHTKLSFETLYYVRIKNTARILIYQAVN